MAKTVSSAGLADFIATGKPTQVFENDQTSKRQASEAKAKLDTKLALVDSSAKTPEPPPEVKLEEVAEKPEATKDDDGLEAEDRELAERAQKRISKKHREMKTAQEEAQAAKEEAAENERFAETLFQEREQWRKRAEQAEGKVAESKPAPDAPISVRPDPKNYMDDKGQFKGLEYAEALAEWSAQQAIEKDRKARSDEAAKAAKEHADAEVRARIEAATKRYPDWEKKVTGSQITLQNECLNFIGRSPVGMDIAYFLAENPKEAARIRALDPYIAVGEMGKLATRFEKAETPSPKAEIPATTEVKTPPAPITPISTSGTGTVQVDPAKMDFKQLRAWHKERRKAGLER